MENFRNRVLDALNLAQSEGYITRFTSVADLISLSYEILSFKFSEEEISEMDDADYVSVFDEQVA